MPVDNDIKPCLCGIFYPFINPLFQRFAVGGVPGTVAVVLSRIHGQADSIDVPVLFHVGKCLLVHIFRIP